mmetsp:Transcript_3822/g.13130  ORF Transcript_3822/g.13130 Transcript_3822/m.13130 type:complete len:230 (+) Transcript_3822:1-690(+)
MAAPSLEPKREPKTALERGRGAEPLVGREEDDGPGDLALEQGPEALVEGAEALLARDAHRQGEEALVAQARGRLEPRLHHIHGVRRDGRHEARARRRAQVRPGRPLRARRRPVLAEHHLELVVAAELRGVADEAPRDVRGPARPQPRHAAPRPDLLERADDGQGLRRILEPRLDDVRRVHREDRQTARGAAREHALPERQLRRGHVAGDVVAHGLVEHERQARVGALAE